MFAAARYRNTLVEIERGRRAAMRAAYAECSSIMAFEQAAEIAENGLAEVLRLAREERVSTQSRKDSPERKVAIRLARDRRREAVNALAAERKRLRETPELVSKFDAINTTAADLRRNARAYCGVYWGTYQLVEDQDQAARKAPLYADGEPNDPRYKRFTGEGAVSVQLVGGINEASLASDTQVQLARVDDRSGRDRFRLLSVRVGSDDARRPIFAVWPMKMHRPLPEGCRIKRVTVTRKLRGPYEEWAALFSVEVADVTVAPQTPERVVSVDLGWRSKPDGTVRVGVWGDDVGAAHEIALSAHEVASLRKASEIESTRAQDGPDGPGFDSAIKIVCAMRESAPEWFRTATATAHAWRSEARLASLVRKWEHARWVGDEGVYTQLAAWLKRDHHLWHYESGQRIGALRHRRDRYRVAAAMLAERYDVLVLESLDLRTFARTPAVGRAEHREERANDVRHLVAPSDLRSCLRDAFRRRGRRVVEVSAVETTMRCHVCGDVEAFDAAASIRHTCRNGHEWDQDVNACANLIERFRAEPSPDPARSDNSAEPKESRWARARRLHNERGEREAARKGFV
jgi:transposase